MGSRLPVRATARRQDHPWAIGELAFWLWRAGTMASAPRGAATPYARQMDGDWRAAAAEWDEIGCPHEAACARADSDDHHVAAILAKLGATTRHEAADTARRRGLVPVD